MIHTGSHKTGSLVSDCSWGLLLMLSVPATTQHAGYPRKGLFQWIHRIPEWLRLSGPSGGYLFQLPAQGGTFRAQDHVQVGPEDLQGRWHHKLPGKPVPVLHHSYSKKCFLMFRCSLLCSTLCPLPLVLTDLLQSWGDNKCPGLEKRKAVSYC